MLNSLYIENFAIIDCLTIDFSEGMTVLTGETGAGKSIIIDAIGQLLGERSQTSLVKKGSKKAFIEGVFSLNHPTLELTKEFEIYDLQLDEEIVVSKTIKDDGKASMKLNYRTVSQSVIKKLIPYIIDIHNQFDTHQLFNPQTHLAILDQFIGKKINEIYNQYINHYHQLVSLKKKKSTLENEVLSDEQLDFYQTQINEINEIDLENIDEEYLLNEKQRIQNYEKTKQRMDQYNEYIDGYQGAISQLKNALDQLQYLTDDSHFENFYSKIYDLYYNLIDANDNLNNYYQEFNFDENYINEIQETLFTLNKLKRKYGQDIESIKKSKNEIQEKIDHFHDRDQILINLNNEITELTKQSQKEAKQMSDIRKKYAHQFVDLVSSILKKLYLENVRFDFQFDQVELSQNGIDNVTMMISTNPGQDLQPLHKIASGGELSRIMLAIKTVCNQFTSIETMIFDEADTGVSGKVAESIGKIMHEISKKQQVICITHLAQVAAFADHHLSIEKNANKDQTTVTIHELSQEKSIHEIAKMISGKDVTEESLNHARKLKQNSV